MSNIERSGPRWASYWFGDTAIAFASHEAALGIFTRAMVEAYENGRADAAREAVKALSEAFAVLDGVAGDEHCTSPEIVRVAQVVEATLAAIGGQ